MDVPAAPASMPQSERAALAVLLSVDGLGPMTLGRLIDVTGSAAAVLELARHSNAIDLLVEASRSRSDGERAMPADVAARIVEALGGADRTLRDIERLHLRLVVPSDREYPRRLMAIEVPPPGLFVRG